jgi:hypothetical protein
MSPLAENDGWILSNRGTDIQQPFLYNPYRVMYQILCFDSSPLGP